MKNSIATDDERNVLKECLDRVAEKVDLIAEDKQKAINIIRGVLAFGQIKHWLQFIRNTCENDMSLADVFYPDSKVNTQLKSLIE